MVARRICIIGSFDSEYDGHIATRDAVIHAADARNAVINTRWVTPDELANPELALAGADAALIACRNPKHPRRLMPDVLHALTWLRKCGLPTLGIECGFQHMVIEIAREVMGRPQANSTAYEDRADPPVIRGLDADAGTRGIVEPSIQSFQLRSGTRLAAVHAGSEWIEESFRSEFAVNPDYVGELEGAGAAFSIDGYRDRQAREGRFAAALEWRAQPFYLGVAYLPQFRSSPERPHPLIASLVDRALLGD
jgi:CTP synthase (UTP-ammonia lyase)